jgi:hypothetical protein
VSQLQAQIQELFQQQEASFEKHIVALSSGLASPNARPALSYIALFEEVSLFFSSSPLRPHSSLLFVSTAGAMCGQFVCCS